MMIAPDPIGLSTKLKNVFSPHIFVAFRIRFALMSPLLGRSMKICHGFEHQFGKSDKCPSID